MQLLNEKYHKSSSNWQKMFVGAPYKKEMMGDNTAGGAACSTTNAQDENITLQKYFRNQLSRTAGVGKRISKKGQATTTTLFGLPRTQNSILGSLNMSINNNCATSTTVYGAKKHS